MKWNNACYNSDATTFFWPFKLSLAISSDDSWVTLVLLKPISSFDTERSIRLSADCCTESASAGADGSSDMQQHLQSDTGHSVWSLHTNAIKESENYSKTSVHTVQFKAPRRTCKQLGRRRYSWGCYQERLGPFRRPTNNRRRSSNKGHQSRTAPQLSVGIHYW